MTASDSSPRRERVEKGIYRSLTSEGERFSVIYRDREGRQRLSAATADGAPLVTLPQARKRREELRVGARRGEVTVRSRVTFVEYARDWLDATEGRKRPSTAALDRSHVERHLIPRLGRQRLHEIDADTVAALVSFLLTEGKVVRVKGRDERVPLAGNTVRTVLGILRRIMARAVRAKLVAANPVDALQAEERPKVETLGYPELELTDFTKLLVAVPERWRTLVHLTLTSGLRQEEALGLRWRDVDTSGGLIRVRQAHGRHGITELKTRAARREIGLEPEAARLLAAHRLASRHSDEDDLVFATADGKALGHRRVLRVVERARAASGLDAKCEAQGARRLTFHGLRHAYGSLRIANGDAPADVSRAMGHADATVTLRVYAHEIEKARRLERERESIAVTFDGLGAVGEVP